MELCNFGEGELLSKRDATHMSMNWFQKISRLLGDVFVPIIPILVATGLFMGVRGLIQNLGVTLDPTLLKFTQILIDTPFAFLPALVVYSVMKRSDIVNIGLHFFLKNVRPYAASCSEA